MKIRLGFVSNSSSASYTIMVNADKDELYLALTGTKGLGYELRDDSWFKAQIQEAIKDNETYISEVQKEMKDADTDTSKEFRTSCIESYEKHIEELKSTLEKANDLSGWDLLKAILLFNSVRTDEDFKSVVLFKYWTCMHNSFDEALPEILKELIFTCLSKNIRVKIEMEGA